jgi:hypothetical protein
MGKVTPLKAKSGGGDMARYTHMLGIGCGKPATNQQLRLSIGINLECRRVSAFAERRTNLIPRTGVSVLFVGSWRRGPGHLSDEVLHRVHR